MNMKELYVEIDRAYADRDWESALLILANALDELPESEEDESKIRAAIENELSVLYFNQGNYDDAEAHGVAACEYLRGMVGDRNPEYANALCNLAGIYSKADWHEKSKDMLKEALDIYDEVYGHNSAIYYHTIVGIAAEFQALAEYDMAAYYYQIAVDICRSQKEYLAMATHLYHIGMNQILQGDNPRAVSTLEEAAGICFEKGLKDSNVYSVCVETLNALREPCSRCN